MSAPLPKARAGPGEMLGRRPPNGSLVENPVARGTDRPLDLVGDSRALPQSVLDHGLVPVTPVLILHLHSHY